jgi:SAM-dependent methyltransferase
MKTLAYQTLGRASEILERIGRRPYQSSELTKTDNDTRSTYDRTGLTVQTAHKLEVLHRSDDLLYVRYNRPSHSFWRAQEFSLFHRHRELFERPVADFGCGDGSFASVLFESVDCGIDHDTDALAIASQYNLYEQLVTSQERHIPLGDRSVNSVFSNSVLEHVSDLGAILAELRRIIAPGGRLVLTVPLLKYRDDLTKYFGSRTSEEVNRESSHCNLLTESEWRKRLKDYGFTVDLVIHYQPDWYTFWYRFHRLSGPRALGRFIADLDVKLWNRYRHRYLAAVRESIEQTSDGANIFVNARRLN